MSTQQNTETSQSDLPPPVTYMNGGVQVHFPTKAYPSQLAMMSKVIQGLKNKQNCLLESPTGSGKSLALLCSALAWQRHEAERVDKYNAAIDERERESERENQQVPPRKGRRKQRPQSTECDKNCENNGLEKGQGGCGRVGSGPVANFEIELTDDEDDFQPPKRAKQSSSPLKDEGEIEEVKVESPTFEKSMSSPQMEESMELGQDDPLCPLADKKLTVPKIFFGTRTHKQIAQITRELRKTVYKNVRSVILASREFTCVNPMLTKVPNKNEACRELLDNAHAEGGGCRWHLSAKLFGNFANLGYYGVGPGYDLEEFVQGGRNARACPYYATRHMMTTADIIFCPYNYLVEPKIRKSMNIELSGQVVIFDEAHNMEDCSRDAASSSLSQDDMQAAMQDCERVGRMGMDSYAHLELANLLSTVSLWIDSESRNNMMELDFTNEGKHWIGTDFVASMTLAGIMDKVKNCKEHYRLVLEQRNQQMDIVKEGSKSKPTSKFGPEQPVITSATTRILEDIFGVFEQLVRGNGKNRDDFRVALLKSSAKTQRRFGQNSSRIAISLNFWCLNPAIAFGDLKDEVHSIILTSGTLSPTQSFQSELGTPFQIKLEANHVIDPNQVYAGVISSGPNYKKLNGTFQSVETVDYQDELGSVVMRVCSLIPHGVLCFFPSYRLLDKVTERWETTGCWNKIQNIKDIYVEPKNGNFEFKEAISSFYASIEATNDGPRGSTTGALFLAVCRGKVSEGLDFADNNARAVICIGIPFPNFRDLQVTLKREYNEKNRARGLLSGSEWYEIQAFRALNQALGRCIRHRNDWGAILLVDSRFQQTPRYVESLSRWVRSSIRPFHSWLNTEGGLVEFRDRMLSTMPMPVRMSKDIDIDMPLEVADGKPNPTNPPNSTRAPQQGRLFSIFAKTTTGTPSNKVPKKYKGSIAFDDADED